MWLIMGDWQVALCFLVPTLGSVCEPWFPAGRVVERYVRARQSQALGPVL